jgi:polyhydroxyalkanoate synthesis regulator phasin
MDNDARFWSDVLAAVAKAQNEERAARVRHIEDVARDLRAEFRREVMELREEVGELVAEVHKLINDESVMRKNAVEHAYSVLNAKVSGQV